MRGIGESPNYEENEDHPKHDAHFAGSADTIAFDGDR
jgi:hypothetical protein